MAKVNVNSASRDELVDVAGLRPAVADAIVKHREEHGRIDGPDALLELRGVGASTVDQVKDALSFGAEKAKEVAGKAAETAEAAGRAGAETAKAGADAGRRAAEKGAEVTSIAARAGVDMAQQAAQRATAGMAEAGRAVASGVPSGEGAQQISRLVVDLMSEQVQANVEALQALAKVRSWREALEVQNDFVRGNLERATQGASRYVETVSRLMTAGMGQAGRDKGRKAA